MSTTASKQYKAWNLNDLVLNSRMSKFSPIDFKGISSFSAVNCMIAINMNPITILPITKTPHSATKSGAIFMSCGPLWSDKRVYRLAKELQLNHQSRSQKNFYTDIPAWAPKFWRPKIKIYPYLQWFSTRLFLPFKPN